MLDLLTSLVEKSLVLYEAGEARFGGEADSAGGRSPGGSEGRYRLLETVRQYARDRLLEAGEAEALRGRHRDWFLALAEAAEPELEGAHQGEWLDRLEREHDNLRVGLEWSAAQGQAEAGLRLGGALGTFWSRHGYWTEGRERLAGLLALPGAEARTAARAKALTGAGWPAWRQGDLGEARALLEESLAIFRELGDKYGVAWELWRLGTVVRGQGEHGAAWALGEESLAIFRELGDKRGIAWALRDLGHVAFALGDHSKARALFEESLALSRELGDKQSAAYSLAGLGALAHDQGGHGPARALLEESLAIFRELGDRWGIAGSLRGLGSLALSQGDLGAARGLLEESLALAREMGDKEIIALNLQGLAVVAVAQRQHERAARLCGAAEALREAIGTPLHPVARAEYEPSVTAVRTALGEEAFAAAWAEGRAMSLEEALRSALEELAPP